jgi:hypothetical protein
MVYRLNCTYIKHQCIETCNSSMVKLHAFLTFVLDRFSFSGSLSFADRTHGFLLLGGSENLSDMAVKEEVPLTIRNQNLTITIANGRFIG